MLIPFSDHVFKIRLKRFSVFPDELHQGFELFSLEFFRISVKYRERLRRHDQVRGSVVDYGVGFPEFGDLEFIQLRPPSLIMPMPKL